jgi:DNA-binding transcriptional ArsR family regulator
MHRGTSGCIFFSLVRGCEYRRFQENSSSTRSALSDIALASIHSSEYTYFVIWRNSEGVLVAVSEVFRALSDPTRREILFLLRAGDKSAGELAEHFPLSKSTLSGHFNVLKGAGLIVSERRATTIVYSINVSAFEEALGALMQLLSVGETNESAGKSGEVREEAQ